VLEVPRSELEPTGEDEYYVFELIGLKVEEEGGGELGSVTDVLPGVANDVLQLDSGVSLPMVEDCIRTVDLAEGRILIGPGFVMPS
jgi:16S rRNA processing protein RimM